MLFSGDSVEGRRRASLKAGRHWNLWLLCVPYPSGTDVDTLIHSSCAFLPHKFVYSVLFLYFYKVDSGVDGVRKSDYDGGVEGPFTIIPFSLSDRAATVVYCIMVGF